MVPPGLRDFLLRPVWGRHIRLPWLYGHQSKLLVAAVNSMGKSCLGTLAAESSCVGHMQTASDLYANDASRSGAVYNHVASKIIFVRIFRKSHHLYSHTGLSWTVWTALLVLASGIAYVLAVGIAVKLANWREQNQN